MFVTQSITDQPIPATRSRSSPWIEPLLGCVLGGSGGLLQSAVTHTSNVSGGFLGAIFGMVFGLFFAQRASSPGAGLIWGLASSFLLWIISAGRIFYFASLSGHSAAMLQDARAHFPELVGFFLCIGMPVGVGLGIRRALRASSADRKFAWGRAIVAGGVSGTLGGFIFGRWVSSGDYFPLLVGFGELSACPKTIALH